MRVAAVGIHATERAFANSSSLCLRWELTGCEGLAYWSDMNNVERFEATMWERFLVLLNASGLVSPTLAFLVVILLFITYEVTFRLERADVLFFPIIANQ